MIKLYIVNVLLYFLNDKVILWVYCDIYICEQDNNTYIEPGLNKDILRRLS